MWPDFTVEKGNPLALSSITMESLKSTLKPGLSCTFDLCPVAGIRRLGEAVCQSKQSQQCSLCLHRLALLGAAEMGKAFRLKDRSDKITNKVEPYILVPATFNTIFSERTLLLLPCCTPKEFSWYLYSFWISKLWWVLKQLFSKSPLWGRKKKKNSTRQIKYMLCAEVWNQKWKYGVLNRHTLTSRSLVAWDPTTVTGIRLLRDRYKFV